MFKVGITGRIGSGKSTVCRVLEVLGVPIFKADDEGKRILQEDADAKRAVIALFGDAMYPEGKLDRKALAAIVFNDEAALEKLNSIVHPLVRERFRVWAEERQAPYVVMEAAILMETGGHKQMDHIVVVHAREVDRVARVIARDGVTEDEVRARIKNQIGKERIGITDSVIMNDGLQLLLPQVIALHTLLLEKAKHLPLTQAG